MKSILGSVLVAGVLLAGCAQEETPAPDTRVENRGTGVALAALPASFRVAANDAEALRLVADGGGSLEILAMPEQSHGVNLHEAVNDQEEWIESQPDGKFFGFQELMGPLGTAFTSRGMYTGSEGPIEVLRVFMVHPQGGRRLDVIYTYPPGEGQMRAQHVLELLGEMEPLDPPGSP